MNVDVTIDRIEGGIAVLEVGGDTVDWPVDSLPQGVKEGDRMTFAISRVSEPDLSAAEQRLERLRQSGPAGDDIEL